VTIASLAGFYGGGTVRLTSDYRRSTVGTVAIYMGREASPMRSRLLVVFLATVPCFVAVPAMSASANTVTSSWVHDNDTVTVRDWCNFPIRLTLVGVYKRTDFFDDDGTLFKTTLRPGGGLYRYIVSAHGTSLSTTSGFSETYTYNPDGSIATLRDTGMVFSFSVPGEGVVLLVAGHFVLDLNTDEVTFEAGPRGEDLSRLCAVLR
jgi:hypothetical protein